MDRFFRNFLELTWEIKGISIRFLDLIFLAALTGSGLIMRVALMGGNYQPFCLLDYCAAIITAGILFLETKNKVRAMMGYALILILPTLVMLGAYWQRTDIIYIIPLLGAIYFIMKGYSVYAAVLYSAAILLNGQAVFLLPLFLIMWFLGKINGKGFILIGAVTIERILSGTDLQYKLFGYGNEQAAGRILDGIEKSLETWNAWKLDESAIIAGQAISETVMPLTDSWPNIYAFFGPNDFVKEYAAGGFLLTAAIMVMISFLFYNYSDYLYKQNKIVEISAEYLIECALFFAICMPFFLPHMNARSGLIADILALILAMLNYKKGYVACLQIIISFSMYQRCFTGLSRYPLTVYAIGMFVLLIITGIWVWKDTKALGGNHKTKETELAHE